MWKWSYKILVSNDLLIIFAHRQAVSFLTSKNFFSSQFFDLDIEDPLGNGQVKLVLSPKQRAKPAASRTRTCTNVAVCIASGECPSLFRHRAENESVSGHAKMPPASHQVSATSLKLLIQQIHPHVRVERDSGKCDFLIPGYTVGTELTRSKQDQRRGYQLWATSWCTSGTELATRVQTKHFLKA